MSRIGVFSGSFDPFHVGHLESCLVAKAAYELDKVAIMIEKCPRGKSVTADYKDRKEMIRLATASFPSLQLVDVGTDNITTENSLPVIKQLFPDSEYWYIAGSDIVAGLDNWHQADMFYRSFKLCVVLRSNEDRVEITDSLESIKQEHPDLQYHILPEVWSEVSSSKVRLDISRYGSSQDIHKNVLRYIIKNKLYAS